MKERMINYLQYKLERFQEDEKKFGMDHHTEKKLDELIACKEMVECLIGEPVNLGLDGKVTIGF